MLTIALIYRTRSCTMLANQLKRSLIFLLACLPWVVIAEPSSHTTRTHAVQSANKPASTHPHAVRYNRGVLWKIESEGRPHSYLFGTIHTDDPRVTELPPPVRQAFEQSHSFTMELLTSGAGFVTMAESMFFNDENNLKAVLGKDLFEQTRQALIEIGLPTLGLEKKKPWAIIMALSMPRQPRTGLFLDLALQLQATLQSKPTHGLESMEEQLAVFNDMTLQDQVILLKETLRVHNQMNDQFEELIEAYLDRDLTQLMRIVHKHKPRDDRVYNSMMDRLLVQRNIKMAERMQTRLQEGNAFIAVGAGHLPGERGILRLLELSGYRLTSVY
jgi:uncharacterized protein